MITRPNPTKPFKRSANPSPNTPTRNPLVIPDILGKVKPKKRPGEDSYLVDYAVSSRLKKPSTPPKATPWERTCAVDVADTEH
jgi:hypothetical protein